MPALATFTGLYINALISCIFLLKILPQGQHVKLSVQCRWRPEIRFSKNTKYFIHKNCSDATWTKKWCNRLISWLQLALLSIVFIYFFTINLYTFENKNHNDQTYLRGRQKHTTVTNFSSKNEYINYGVPQGSVLGPLLFLTYVNDLNKAIKYSDVHHFKDDTTLILKVGTSSNER